MLVQKNLSIKTIYEFAGHHLYWLAAWMLIVASVEYFSQWKLFTIPWLPLSLIGTAVAFYVGFKNNQSYDRLWEARRIWGGIVNHSRKFATTVKNLQTDNASADRGEAIRRQVLLRHIAWVYQLREQLLVPAPWEHVSVGGRVGYYNRKRREKNFGDYKEELAELTNRTYISEAEKKSIGSFANKATQLLDLQSQSIQQLYQEGAINAFQQISLQNLVNSFYDEQGAAERIKRFPFPRKYASFSFVFVCIFIFLLPFGIVAEFNKLGPAFVWLTIPIGVIVGWIYVVMEMIGDYSESPFQGLHNDIPMLSICRTIEIDVLQMMGEKDVPKPIQPKGENLL